MAAARNMPAQISRNHWRLRMAMRMAKGTSSGKIRNQEWMKSASALRNLSSIRW